ncbi:MAG: hypothetical protein ACLRRT_11410 [Ruthenibacterium lactatiformans]
MKTKQLLCGVLAAAVLFTGCGAQPGTSGGSSAQGDGTPMQAKGRFVENDITPPGAAGCTLVSLTARPDGGLDYIAPGLPRRPVNIHIPIFILLTAAKNGRKIRWTGRRVSERNARSKRSPLPLRENIL